MKKEELKKILKPLIKECIKEVIFEDGTLSNIVAEVALGLGSTPKEKIVESKRDNTLAVKKRHQDIERRKKMLNAIGKDAYNGVDLFEGTTPASKPLAEGATQGPLSGVAPNDPGVDISSFMGSSHVWKKVVGK